MSLDAEPTGGRRILPLTQICQRVASAHVDSICSLGEDVRIELVWPILQHCSAQTLLRLEQATPSLTNETPELWKALCFRAFPLVAEQHYADEDPESWRDAYFILRDWEKQRLEAVGNKLRSQREEMEQRRKESQVKFTEKLPAVKRSSRGWGQTQPKTLFQKTRSDAVKMQKGIYGARVPIPPAKSVRMPPPPSAKMVNSLAAASLPPSSRVSGTRVSVNAIPSKPVTGDTAPTSSTLKPPLRPNPFGTSVLKPAQQSPMMSHSATKHVPSTLPSLPRLVQSSNTPPAVEAPPVTFKPPSAKKTPSATIFMPKHRSYSQLPTQTTGMRSRV